jgi:DNA-binding GntR family transcriptional regulator
MNRSTTRAGTEKILAAARADAIRPNSHGPSGKAGEIIGELEHRLITGQYRFGDTLSINRLAEEFDASRQPIGAAINHLRSLGYLKVVPQVGCNVVSPSPEEIGDFFYMLGKIESAVAGLAAVRYLAEEAEVLLAIAAHIAQTPFDNDSHREDWTIGVDAYHAQIRNMARSPSLAGRVQNLWRLSDFYLWQGALNLQPQNIDVANRERREIAEVIGARAVEAVETLMEKHVRGKPRRVGIA